MSKSKIFHYQHDSKENDLVIVVTRRSKFDSDSGKPEQLPRLHKFNQKEWSTMYEYLKNNDNVVLEVLNLPAGCEVPEICKEPRLFEIEKKLGTPLDVTVETPENDATEEAPEKKPKK